MSRKFYDPDSSTNEKDVYEILDEDGEGSGSGMKEMFRKWNKCCPKAPKHENSHDRMSEQPVGTVFSNNGYFPLLFERFGSVPLVNCDKKLQGCLDNIFGGNNGDVYYSNFGLELSNYDDSLMNTPIDPSDEYECSKNKLKAWKHVMGCYSLLQGIDLRNADDRKKRVQFNNVIMSFSNHAPD
jgi:hypothetical protein